MKYLENILFIVPMLTGIIYLIAGWFLQSRPPKKINNMYGYLSCFHYLHLFYLKDTS